MTTPTTRQIDYSNFYKLEQSEATRYFQLTIGARDLSEDFFPSASKQRIKGPRPPFEAWPARGGEVADIMWCPFVMICASERTIELMQEHRVTGWDSYALHLHDQTGMTIPGHEGLSISGRAGKWDVGRSEIVHVPTSRGGKWTRAMYRGAYFENDEWDGSDIFCWRGAALGVTARWYKIFKSHKITGCMFTKFPELMIPVDSI